MTNNGPATDRLTKRGEALIKLGFMEYATDRNIEDSIAHEEAHIIKMREFLRDHGEDA